MNEQNRNQIPHQDATDRSASTQNQHKSSKKRSRNRKKRDHEKTSVPASAIRESPVAKKHMQMQNSDKRQQGRFSKSQGRSGLAERKNEGGNKRELSIERSIKEEKWKELFSNSLKAMENCKPGDEVKILLQHLQPSPAIWIQIFELIYNELLSLMSPMGVEALLAFGSSMTGLDFFGSDLDYYVQLKDHPVDNEAAKPIIQKVARQRNQAFRIICTILHARVPIIRLQHLRTKVTCDVNFTSSFGYYNSCFIGKVLNYDTRVKELAVILKLWSKAHKISERMIMSNYCLMTCLVFYLQNLEQPMLDSIKNSQALCDPMVLDCNPRWNVAFNDAINWTRQNHLSVRQLLVGFFEFYNKLNFSNYIVSIYGGYLIKRADFDKHPDFENYRNIIKPNLQPLQFKSPEQFVVQDGFELNLNIGIKDKRSVVIFFEAIKATFTKCLELKDKPLSELLTKLFTDIQLPHAQGKMMKEKKKFAMTVHLTAGDLKVNIILISKPDKVKQFLCYLSVALSKNS